jgi:hypothetical protein
MTPPTAIQIRRDPTRANEIGCLRTIFGTVAHVLLEHSP